MAFLLLVGELCHGLTENAVECLLGAGGLSLFMVLHWGVVGNMQVWARAGAQLVDSVGCLACTDPWCMFSTLGKLHEVAQ